MVPPAETSRTGRLRSITRHEGVPTRVLLLLLRLFFWALVVMTPLFGVWTASSLAAYWNGPVWLVVLAGLALFPLGPLLWELRAERRRRRRAERRKRAASALDYGKKDQRILLPVDRLMLRTLAMNAVFLTAMLWLWPATAFTALSGRGDWMLDGRDGPAAERIRAGLFRAADGLEWLFEAGDEQPFVGLEEEKPPPPPPSKNVDGPSTEDLLADLSGGGDEPPEVGDDDSADGGQPQPDDPVASPPEEPPGFRWPAREQLHPLVARAPPEAEVSIEALGTYLRRGEPDPWLRLKAMHDWVAWNIAYDFDSLDDGSYVIKQTSGDVFASRRGVCAGYSNVMVALGRVTGDEIVYVGGHSRERDGSIAGSGHAWNAARIDGRWWLMDVTWDSGHRGDDGAFERDYGTEYLLTPPEVFVTTHLPQDDGWQLLPTPVSRGEFTRLPMMTAAFYAEGLMFVEPTRSQVSVDDRLTLPLYNPGGRSILATYEPRGGGPDTRCTVRGAGRVVIDCSFDRAGTWDLTLYTAESKNQQHWSVGRLEVNSGG